MTDWVAAANQLEEHSELLSIRLFHYMLDHNPNADTLKILEEFVSFCIEKNEEDLNTPRGKDNKSYNQRREEQLASKMV